MGKKDRKKKFPNKENSCDKYQPTDYSDRSAFCCTEACSNKAAFPCGAGFFIVSVSSYDDCWCANSPGYFLLLSIITSLVTTKAEKETFDAMLSMHSTNTPTSAP